MTPGCDSCEDNNLSSDAEVPTLPAKTLPLSRSRSLKRDIVGTHPIFVFYSLVDVRDGFARDCPHRHPVRLMLALRNRSGAAPSFFCGCRAISTVAGAAQRRRDTSGARWRRYAGDRLAGRFPWSGWGARASHFHDGRAPRVAMGTRRDPAPFLGVRGVCAHARAYLEIVGR